MHIGVFEVYMCTYWCIRGVHVYILVYLRCTCVHIGVLEVYMCAYWCIRGVHVYILVY